MSDLRPVPVLVQQLRQQSTEARQFAQVAAHAAGLAIELAELLDQSATMIDLQETRFGHHLEAWRANSGFSARLQTEIREAMGLGPQVDHERVLSWIAAARESMGSLSS